MRLSRLDRWFRDAPLVLDSERPKLPKVPPELDRIVDRVLAYRPKPKTKAAKRRKRRDQYAKRRKSESSI